MKRLAFLFGLAMIWCGQIVHAQMLTAVSLSGSATASATSIDYRYTRHTRGGSGRGGGYHVTVYYTWDPHTDEAVTASLPLILNGLPGNATAIGTYYAPTYAATASASTSLINTATQAVFSTSYQAAMTLNTPQVAHQRVAATAQPSGTFYFTLANYANVTLTGAGSANGVVRIFNQNGAGVVVGPLLGPGTITTETSLPPGNYRIDSSLAYSAIQDTQLNALLNPGTTSDTYSFTVTFTPGEGD